MFEISNKYAQYLLSKEPTEIFWGEIEEYDNSIYLLKGSKVLWIDKDLDKKYLFDSIEHFEKYYFGNVETKQQNTFPYSEILFLDSNRRASKVELKYNPDEIWLSEYHTPSRLRGQTYSLSRCSKECIILYNNMVLIFKDLKHLEEFVDYYDLPMLSKLEKNVLWGIFEANTLSAIKKEIYECVDIIRAETTDNFTLDGSELSLKYIDTLLGNNEYLEFKNYYDNIKKIVSYFLFTIIENNPEEIILESVTCYGIECFYPSVASNSGIIRRLAFNCYPNVLFLDEHMLFPPSRLYDVFSKKSKKE